MRFISLVFFTAFSALFLTGCGQESNPKTSWNLDQSSSSLTLTAVKKGSVAEAFHFKAIKGSVTATGKAKININLASIDTGIPIRDDRMKKMLFEVVLFPMAVITADLNLRQFSGINIGQRTPKELTFNLALHGEEEEFETEVYINRLSHNSFVVTTIEPIMIDAKTFKLVKGINALAKVAKLPTINTVVPVNFSLLFRRQ